MSLVIALDYDGTLFSGSIGQLGEPCRDVINKALECQKTGMCELVLWTCREAGGLQEAMDRCKAEGIIFDAINSNSPFENKYRVVMLKRHGHIFANKKIYADYYIDDKSPGSIEFFLQMDIEAECAKTRKRDKELNLDNDNDNGNNEPLLPDNKGTYVAMEDLTGFNPDGPDFLSNDNGIIYVKKGTLLHATGQYDEYAIEYIMDIHKPDGGTTVMLHRERVCDNPSDVNYYANYFSLPKGLIWC
jgi:hypothetical protein